MGSQNTIISDCHPQQKYSSHPCKTNSSSLSPKLKTWNLLFPSIIQVLLNLFPLDSLFHQTLPFFPSLPPPSQCTMPGSLHAGGLGPMTLPFALFKPCCTTAFKAQPYLYIKLSSSFLLFDVGFYCQICVTFHSFHPTSLVIISKTTLIRSFSWLPLYNIPSKQYFTLLLLMNSN